MNVMKQIILFIFIMQFSSGSTLTLDQVLASAGKHNSLSQAIEQESLSLEAKNQADTAARPLVLYGTGTKAYPDYGPSGYEHSVGLLKNIPLGSIRKQDQEIARLNNQASLLEEEQKVLNFKNRLKNLYHQHCLEYKNYSSFKQSYQDFAKLFKKKQMAYKYQEVSKVELMQLELEKNRLYAQLQEMRMKQQISKQNLLMLGRVNHSEATVLSCRDIYPVRENIRLSRDAFHLTKEAYKKRIESTQTAIKRYSNTVESVELLGEYSKEIDVERYKIGVAIPLAFTSKKSEKERAASMYRNSALTFQNEQAMLEKKSMVSQLQSTLKSNAVMIKAIQKNIQNYQKKLLPLMKKSYDLGESSVMEYLLSRQQFYQLNRELFLTQKTYYNTLFTLYSVSEMKDK
ncbi:MAG: TolC family protein [Campylobacterota bacterium]|nr:TolC family protein [Campylobacterota bacterium]